MPETKQAVVDETDAAAQPAPKVESAQDDGIDALLAEFDQKNSPASPPEPKADTTKVDPAVLAREVAELKNARLQEDIKKETDDIFRDYEMSQELRESYLDAQARKYPAAAVAFANKQKDPGTWNKWKREIVKKAAVEFAPFKKADIDPNATADRDAVAAAVRGASAKVTSEPAPNLSRMSDAELRKYTFENFGF